MSTSQFVGHAASLSLNDLIRSADEMQKSGKVEEAANLYRQWLSHSRDPSKHMARFHYGWVLQKLNLFEEAQNVQRDFINDYAKHLSGGTFAMHWSLWREIATKLRAPRLVMKTSKPKTALVFWLVGVAHAQTIPDAGTLFRQAEQNLPMNRQAAPLIALPPLPLAINLERDGEKKAVFQAFKFTGNKRLKEEVLQAAISVFRQQEIPFKDLHRIPQAIEDAYRQKGWIIKAYLPRQDLAAGVLMIHILEESAGSSSAIQH